MNRRTLAPRWLAIAALCIGWSGCVSGPLKYTPNGLALLDVLEDRSNELLEDVQVGERDRVVIVDLDLSSAPGTYPSAIVYDMLAMALTKRGVTVLERDTRAFYASVLEGSSEKLPLQVGGPCTLAPIDEANTTAIPGSMAAPPPLSAPRTAASTSTVAVAEPAFPEVFSHGVPSCLNNSGQPVIAKPMSATHVLAYRVLYYGVSIDPTEDSSVIERVVRIDLNLRLIDPIYGTILWADRVETTRGEELPAAVRGLVGDDRYEYFAPPLGGAPVTDTDETKSRFDVLKMK
jgi:hypothetical protein